MFSTAVQNIVSGAIQIPHCDCDCDCETAYLTTYGLIVTVTFDLLTSKSNQFILVLNWT